VSQTRTLRATVVSLGTSDIDVHLLQGTPTAGACVSRHDKAITATLTPGTWYLSLDTYVSAGVERAGAYALVVLP
jgi:hypothetical protein